MTIVVKTIATVPTVDKCTSPAYIAAHDYEHQIPQQPRARLRPRPRLLHAEARLQGDDRPALRREQPLDRAEDRQCRHRPGAFHPPPPPGRRPPAPVPPPLTST